MFNATGALLQKEISEKYTNYNNYRDHKHLESLRKAKIGEIESLRNQMKDKSKRFQKFNFIEIYN